MNIKGIILLLFICLLANFSCSSQRQSKDSEIEAKQIESNYPIVIKGSISKERVYEIIFPLVFMINKNVSEDIVIFSSEFTYNGKYGIKKSFLYDVYPLSPEGKALSDKYETLNHSPKEYVYWVSYEPNKTQGTENLIHPYLDLMKGQGKNTIHIESIQELKKTNPAFLEGFLGNDSIAIGYLINEKRNVRYTVLPVEIR
jgi:hypothetical protein